MEHEIPINKNLELDKKDEHEDDDDDDTSSPGDKRRRAGAYSASLLENESDKPKSKDDDKPTLTERIAVAEELRKIKNEADKSIRDPENLTPDEQQEAYQQLAAGRGAELADERSDTEPGSLEEQQAMAAEAFQAAVEETGDPEAAEALLLGGDEFTSEDADDDIIDAEIVETQEYPDDEDDPSKAASTTTTSTTGGGGKKPPPPPPTPTPPPSSTPPPSPAPTPSSGTGPGPGGGPPPPTGSTFNYYNIAPPPPSPTSVGYNSYSSSYNQRRALRRGLIVGGIVGYLIGRRRGRIKTEKKLLPIQKKLEKKVTSLQEELLWREKRVRQAVVEKRVNIPVAAALVERSSTRRESIAAVRRKSAERAASATKVPQERIGQVLIAAETRPAAREVVKAEKPKLERPVFAPNEAKVRAETMSRIDLLDLSQKIILDGASLRQVYESQLVSEKGLRRIVAEYLRGGNVRKLLRQELVEREIDFERDPDLRDKARASLSGSGKSALNSLVQQATEEANNDNQAKSTNLKQTSVANKVKDTVRKHPIVDVSLVVVIAVSVAAVVVIASSR